MSWALDPHELSRQRAYADEDARHRYGDRVQERRELMAPARSTDQAAVDHRAWQVTANHRLVRWERRRVELELARTIAAIAAAAGSWTAVVLILSGR